MRNTPRLLIIHNPNAGQKKADLFRAVIDELRSRDVPHTVVETTHAGHATEVAREFREGPYDRIVAAGGDGTLNEVINGMYPSALPLGLIPLGTTNVLAKEILPDETVATITDVLLQGASLTCWLGRAADRYFAFVVSAGPDAEAVNRVNLPLKKILGRTAYGLSFVRNLLWHRDIIYTVTVDGTTHEVGMVVVTRSKFYAGDYICAPDADLSHRSFQVILLPRHGRLPAIIYALKMILHKIPQDKSIRIITGATVEIRANQPAHYQIDGESGGALPLSLSLSQQPVSLLTGIPHDGKSHL